MQGLIPIIFIIAQISSPIAIEAHNATYEYIGQMPEIVVTAPRYEQEDDAWSGMMPETIVTAPKYSSENYASFDEIFANVFPNFAYAQDTKKVDVKIKIDSSNKTKSDDYYVPKGDTVDNDVAVRGGNAKIDGVIDGDLAVMGGMVDVNGMIDGDVAVFGGNLDILGTVDGDAAVFGGNVKNKGTITGDLFVVGGTVLLDSGSIVEGDIGMVGGTVDRDENAEVLGEIETVEIETLEKLLPQIGRIGRAFKWSEKLPGTGIVSGFVGIAVLLVIYIMNLLVLLIFPQSIDKVVEKVQLNTWASVGLGFAIQILFFPLIALFAVSIVGIPLVFLFPLAVFLGMVFGFSALSHIIGEKIIKGLNWQIKGKVGIFSIGWLAVMFLLILGFILRVFGLIVPPTFAFGGIIIYIVATIGIGGVIYALMKREKKEKKK
jgi:cytoskeletal protein CcmA (bactofilin family)